MKRILKEVKEPYSSCLYYMFGLDENHEIKNNNFCKITALARFGRNFNDYKTNLDSIKLDEMDSDWLKGLYYYWSSVMNLVLKDRIEDLKISESKDLIRDYSLFYFNQYRKLKAEFYYFDQQATRANQQMKEVITYVNCLGKFDEYIKLLFQYSNRLKKFGNHLRALEMLKNAETVILQYYPNMLPDLYLIIGDLYYEMGSYGTSIQNLLKSEELGIPYNVSHLWVFFHIIRTYIKLQEFDKVYDYFEKAEFSLQKTSYDNNIVGRYHRLRGEFMFSIGAIDEAISSYTQASEIYREIDLIPSLIDSKIQLANCLIIKGDYDFAIDMLNLIILEYPINNKYTKFYTEYQLCNVYLKSRNVDKAIKWVQKCEKSCQEVTIPESKGMMLLLKSRIETAKLLSPLQINDIIENLEEAISIFDKTKNLEYKGDSLIELAKIKIAQNKPQQAMDCMDEAYTFYLQSNEIYKFFKTVQMMLELNATYSMGIDDIENLVEDMNSLRNLYLDNKFLDFYYYYSLALYYKARSQFKEINMTINNFEIALKINASAEDWTRAAFHYIDFITNDFIQQRKGEDFDVYFHKIKIIIEKAFKKDISIGNLLVQFTRKLLYKKHIEKKGKLNFLLNLLMNFETFDSFNDINFFHIEEKILSNYLRIQD